MNARFFGLLVLISGAFGSIRAQSTLDVSKEPVIGKWVWKTGGTAQIVTFEADGTATASAGAHGTWRPQSSGASDLPKYRVFWQEGLFIDTITLASAGRIEGRTIKNDAINASRALTLTPKPVAPGATPDPLTGKWIWKKGVAPLLVTISADGTASASNGYHGVWEYQPEKFASERVYAILWEDGLFLDTVKFTASGKLEGRSKQGEEVLKERITASRAPTN